MLNMFKYPLKYSLKKKQQSYLSEALSSCSLHSLAIYLYVLYLFKVNILKKKCT